MALPNNGNGVSLAMRLEEDSSIRRLVRETKSLTQWKNKNLIGVASTDAAAYNAALLRHVAAWYTPQVPMPQAIPIEAIRAGVPRGSCSTPVTHLEIPFPSLVFKAPD